MSTEPQKYSEADVRRWQSLHKERGGSMSWKEISEGEGGKFTDNAIRKAVKRLEDMEAPSQDEGVPSAVATVEVVGAQVVDPHELPDDWWDRMWENAKEQARLRMQAQKEETVFTVRVPERLPFMYVWTGDWHLLDGGTDHDLFDDDMAIWTSTPGLYFGIGGDLANWFSPAVLPRAMPANVQPSDYAEGHVRRKVARLHGAEKRILFGVVGNHDEFPGATGWHPVDTIYRDLKIPNLGPGGNVFIGIGTKHEQWSAIEYKVAARHSFNFNSSVNDTNSMRNLWIQAGCPKIVCTAHLHRPTMHQPTFDGVDTVWIRNGSHKRNDHHAKSKNFVHTRPDAPDQPGIIIYPFEDKMIPFRSYRDGLPLLAALREQYAKRSA